MEALGFARGDYRIRVNSREILDATMDAVGLADDVATRLAVLRTIDKADRFALDDLRLLLTTGRRDESGDFTKGAGLAEEQASAILRMTVDSKMSGRPNVSDALIDDARFVSIYGAMLPIINSSTIIESRRALEAIGGDTAAFDKIAALTDAVEAAGYGSRRINIDLSVVRGLEYYTGAVFEAELLVETPDAEGRLQRFGSVGGGGRYDGLVGRFRGENVPSTGFSVGVSRLAAALAAREAPRTEDGPVVVTVMDPTEAARYHALTTKLRAALNDGGTPVPVEMYIGGSGMKAQLKYADRRNAPCVVIQGSDERARGVVQVKDLARGKVAAASIGSREDWVAARPAQQEVDYDGGDVGALAQAVRRILD